LRGTRKTTALISYEIRKYEITKKKKIVYVFSIDPPPLSLNIWPSKSALLGCPVC
jgi:hypothetical protein